MSTLLQEAFVQLSLGGVSKLEELQSLWSGYGAISRYRTEAPPHQLIVKHVMLPDQATHPRGWNTNISHQRKIRSYQVECYWYGHYSGDCDERCRVPKSYGSYANEHEFVLLMEDLDINGFSVRKQQVSLDDIKLCLNWLAWFHARFMMIEPSGLWPTGTYWHLETRPDELQALDDEALKNAAPAIDHELSSCPFQTLVHGDAKLANFCFADDGTHVAAVDFQYVGRGCGMKDVAYFIGSCLEENDCDALESILLDYYFSVLQDACRELKPSLNYDAIEDAWRPLYHLAWADFHRFLKGWSPGHWKIHSYSERISKAVIEQIKGAR